MAKHAALHAKETEAMGSAQAFASDQACAAQHREQRRDTRPPKRAKTARSGSSRLKKPLVALAASLVLVIAIPLLAQAWNAMQEPRYDWYMSGAAGTVDDPYVLSGVRDYRGFVNVVNGTVDLNNDGENESDSFAGKYVKLATDISLNTGGESNVIDPIGGAQTGKTFDGTFDGAGHVIDNYMVTVAEGQPATNLGLFGACGEDSLIENVVVGQNARLSITKLKTDVTQIKNVGLLVGYSAGSIEGCENRGSVYVQTDFDQTKELVIGILNVGGLAGQCLGNVSGCSNAGTIEAYANGAVRTLSEEEIKADERQEPVILMNTGGIVGCAGAVDNMVDENAGTAHGAVTNCSNTGKIMLKTSSEAGLDRFGSPVYSASANTGGVVGYSRGSIENCTNSAYVRAEKGTYAAGVAGNVRSHALTVSSAEPTYYYDDGMLGVETNDDLGVSSYDEEASAAESNRVYVKNCHNSGDVYGHSSPAGVVAAAGTYTEIVGCTNASNTIIMGTRWNKPFPSGIVASARGKVMFCANYGTIVSGEWTNEEERVYSTQDGYYVSGIVGATRSYEDKKLNRISPETEVVGCYNAGSVIAGDDMRQRGIVGDNEGAVYDNLLVDGTVYKNRIAYGMYEGDDEASGGSFSNNYVISTSLLKSGDWFKFVSTDEYKVEAAKDGTMNALTVLNNAGDRTGWTTYWVSDFQGINNGYPVLNTQVDAELTPISDATVTLKENAPYTSVTGSIPQATVTLNGVTLMQNVDFRVIPDENAVDITDEAQDKTPYMATIVGIGKYTGTAAQKLKYGITLGNIANCTVNVETQNFDWNPHTVNPEDVKVTAPSGARVAASEYSVSFDETDTDLTKNAETGEMQAINAGRYTVIISAREDSEHFKGSVKAELTIKAAPIMYTTNEELRDNYALPTAIAYAGWQYNWESTVDLAQRDPSLLTPAVTFEYTGHPIDPEVVSVTFKGKNLAEGPDYRIMYGDKELLESGKTIPAGQENLGVKGGTGYGYVMVKNNPGGNFSNYDVMKFAIVDTDAKVSLEGAEARGTGDVIYEGPLSYEPVTLWYQNQQLTEGVDYTISYTDNTSLGTAHFVATACEDGPFGGTIEGSFNIVEGDPYSFYYTYDDATMTATVTGVAYSGISNSFDMVIPSTTEFAGGEYTKITYANNNYTTETASAAAGTYTVTAIGDFAFGGGGVRGTAPVWVGENFALSKLGIRSVTIPYTVETIGKYAFAGGSTYTDPRLLSAVTFSDIDYSRLTTIEEGAFQSCGNLTEFTFPAMVETIGKSAFRVGTRTQPSKLTKLTFLTQDATLPSNVSESYAFSGVGGGDDAATVTVYGYESATAVKQLVADNATTASVGKHKGMRFSFVALGQGQAAWSVASNEYVAGTGRYLLTHDAPPTGIICLVNGREMHWDGNRFVTLVTATEAQSITNASFSFATKDAPEITLGDVNANGQMNAIDAQIAYDLACNVYTDFSALNEAGWLACDINGDGVVDATDAFAIHVQVMEALGAA